MVTDSPGMQFGESLTAAKDCIRTGPVPEWVRSCPFPAEFKVSPAGSITHLLHDRQIHAELRQTHHHVALRLESMQAVQSESPWRLDFDPRTERITLHFIRTWRDGATRAQADLSGVRVIDRRSPASKPSEPLTLSLMLDDVRPGDILEWAYTIEALPAVLPEKCAALFTLPIGAPVGKYYFSVLFNPARPMQHRGSSPDWQPVKNEDGGLAGWVWTQENYPGLLPEENMPDWHIARPWIQVSDCEDWAVVASTFATAWKEEPDDATVKALAAEISAGASGLQALAASAIHLVQDEYRCMTGDGELDGQPPAPPAAVIRRRYGDAKDLAFLLVHLLKALGAEARLVLVNTVYRQSLNRLLPAPDLFNHALVEYTIAGETRWVDPAQRRAAGHFGAGLPVVPEHAGLAAPPAASMPADACEINESFLLDTAGGWSFVAVVTRARGRHADALRQQLATDGIDAFAKRRLRECAARYVTARRTDPLQYRDDRAANEFFLSEIYEIKDFLVFDARTKWQKLELPNAFIADSLHEPDPGPRRAPFALPHPCRLVHTIELHAVSLAPAAVQQRSVKTNYLEFTRVRKTLAGFWTLTLSLATLADAVPPENLEDHREAIPDIRDQSRWALLLPPGEGRPHRRGDFGALPPSAIPTVVAVTTPPPTPVVEKPVAPQSPPPPPPPPIAKVVVPPAPTPAPPPPPLVEQETELAPVTQPEPVAAAPVEAVAPEPAPAAEVAEPVEAAAPTEEEPPVAQRSPAAPVAAELETPPVRAKKHRRHRRKRHEGEPSKWLLLGASLIGLTLIIIVILIAKHADYWKIFKRRPPPPPATELTPARDQ
jgi:hypothetical protein